MLGHYNRAPWNQSSSSELSNVILEALGALASISLKWAPYSFDSCMVDKSKDKL